MEQPSYWLLDSRSREMAFAGLNMTARDFAKLGELYRNGGMWRDRQVVPAEWVNASTTRMRRISRRAKQWWLIA